jgi:RNA polymerase sigma-70 factor (ECF subfamily)
MRKAQDAGSLYAAELMARVAAQDREAFAALFRLAAPRVKAYLMRLGSSSAAAEELAQDVLLTVWRKADRFDPAKAGVMTWIFVIARNRRIDSLRREASTVTYGTEPPDAPDDDTPSAFDRLDSADNEVRIRRAIATLPAEQQAVIKHSYWDENAHGAIAASLGIPLGTVKSRLRLALARLRAAVEDLQ